MEEGRVYVFSLSTGETLIAKVLVSGVEALTLSDVRVVMPNNGKLSLLRYKPPLLDKRCYLFIGNIVTYVEAPEDIETLYKAEVNGLKVANG